jgi:DNA processing protein
MTSQPSQQAILTDTSAAPTGDLLRAWLRFANVQFSARLMAAFLTHFGEDPRAIFAATDADLEEVPGCQPRHIVRLRDPNMDVTPRQWAWMERPDVRLALRGQPDYPRALRELPDPPPLLFLRGTLAESDRFSVGIVGSRHATPYGRATSERLARELAGYGLTVISGGAVGIDAAAHRGALTGGGRTLAVLGCGLDVDYPRENRALFEQVAAHGALLTEYPLGAQPESWRFPLRNRLISALSLGTLVVEAPRQSGALITARCAVEQGRPVLVVPGNIDRPTSVGSNELLKEGATPITETEDILRALGMVALPARPEHQQTLELAEAGPLTTLSPTSAFQDNAGAPLSSPRAPSLPENQRRLLEGLSLTPRHIDALAQEVGMTAMQAGVEMTLLELNGLVRRLPGNTYIRVL